MHRGDFPCLAGVKSDEAPTKTKSQLIGHATLAEVAKGEKKSGSSVSLSR